MSTPTKPTKQGRKPKIADIQNNCRFCGASFTSDGAKAYFENFFSPWGRKESAGLILAECCGSIGLPLSRKESLSERVCRHCGRKIRNAAELYRFLEKAVSAEADEDLNREADRSKRQLPTTVTPERSQAKKQLSGDEQNAVQTEVGKTSRNALFSENSAINNNNSQNTDSSSDIDTSTEQVLNTYCCCC